MAKSNTKLTHPIRLARFIRFALASLKMRTISLRFARRRSGYQSSRFATQIEAYACIYTSKASNFWHVSKNRAFRTNPEYLAHEKQLQNNPFEAEAETEE